MARRRDMWLWDPRLLKPVVACSIVATVVVVAALYPALGHESLYFLFALPEPTAKQWCARLGRQLD